MEREVGRSGRLEQERSESAVRKSMRKPASGGEGKGRKEKGREGGEGQTSSGAAVSARRKEGMRM